MNTSDVFQQTTRRITEKVARFEKLLRDPDLAPYVAALRNGELPQQPEPVQQGPGTPARPKPRVAAPKKLNGPSPAKPSTSGIRGAIRSLKSKLPAQFTAEHVTRALKAANVAIGARNKDKAIRNTLFKLAQRREVKLVKQGSSGQSNLYTWTAKK